MSDRSRIRHYEILSRLGEGGMGVVYRARDTRLGRVVALKTLHEELAGDEERNHRFEREARIISTMSHPGIATLFDFDREGDVTYLAMELVEGPTLRELLGDGPLTVTRALDCAVQVAEALGAAHAKGVIHRDLKPENIMVAASGHYKVLDFGVARLDPPASPDGPSSTQTPTVSWATRAGGIVGTVTYMSPEQALGDPVDARSDIFSFGSLLYEMLTGRPAFRGNNEIATAQAIVNESPSPVRSLSPKVSRGLELVVGKCLSKKPDDRYAGAEELAADLRALRLERLSDTKSVRHLHAYRQSPLRRRRLNVAAASVAIAALVVTGLAIWAPWRETARQPRQEASPPLSSVAAAAEATPASMAAKPRVVVAFFENNTNDPDADWLDRGLPEMLTTDLSRAGDLDVIATQRLYDLLATAGRDPEEAVNRSTASELARWAGADIVISGAVFRSGQRYRIDAQAYDIASGTVTVAHKVEGEELFDLVDDLTAGLRKGLRVGVEDPGQLQRVTTSSEAAFRDYARGKSFYDRLDFERAAELFEQALSADPDFALARLRLALTLLALDEPQAAAEMVDAAREQIVRMPGSDAQLTRALWFYLVKGDYEQAATHLAALTETHPEHDDASVLWARALHDLAGQPVQATRKLREVLARDPGNLAAITVLADQLAGLGATDAARALLEDARLSNPQADEPLARLIESLEEG